ncbi:hypothetical protein MARINON1_51133 [Marinobacter salarius]|nr:hypothetical protein MBHK15_130477 [Marinobacter salarius]VXB72015.1 hypothetical protein MARINON1_51133 [Marinobacter salarius]
MSHSGGNHKIHPQKKAAEAAFLAVPYYPLDSSNVFRLRTFLALGNGELNLLAFCQGLEAAALNCAVVNEYVRAAFTSDKAKAFCFVEELNSAGSSRHT